MVRNFFLNWRRILELLRSWRHSFSASPFLTEILLRTPNALELLNNRQALTERKTIEQFQTEALLAAGQIETDTGKLDALRSTSAVNIYGLVPTIFLACMICGRFFPSSPVWPSDWCVPA
jgi:glutamine synthetase adenylyltransferase